MFDGRFVGFADFLIRDGHRYRVADTKLARSPTVTALLQLAAYADALVHSGVPVAADAELELGDGTIVRYRVGELIPVYRSQRALLQRLLDGHYTAGTAVGLGRRTRAGVLPLSAVHRAAARQRRSATGRRDASPPARQAP
ncbi:conserved hypothetical protein [Mycobacterium tuberculosis GM 1503]|nr:conserved hypothetical protein [Mycobacterium tuberculosis GM 1503]